MTSLRTALFLTGVYYESAVLNGDHHLARLLAERGWRVAFVSAPISPFHIFARSKDQLQERFHNYRQGGIQHPVGSGEIWSYVPGAMLTPRNVAPLNSRWVFDHWRRFVFPSLPGWLEQHDFASIDLLYIRDPRQGVWVNQIPHQASIYRIADWDAGFEHFDAHNAAMEQSLASSVDLVAYTAHSLEPYVRRLAPKASLYLPNGVDLESFSQVDPPIPDEYIPLEGPIVVYVGSISYWFDFDLISALARSMPQIHFVLIGPNASNNRQLDPLPNVHLLGKRPHSQIQRYLQHADIGIIPFDVNRYPDLIHAVNPLKLYEYTACGLPVVATRWEELEQIDSPAKLCSTTQEFSDAIRYFLDHKPDPAHQRAFARQHTWSSRFTTLMSRLEPLLESHP